MASVTDGWVGITKIVGKICLVISLLLPSQLLALPIYEYVETKDGIQLSEKAINSIQYPSIRPLYMVKSKVKNGLTPKEAEDAHKILKIDEVGYEHILMKIESEDKIPYYFTEKSWIFHGNPRIVFSLYRYSNNQTDLVWQKTFGQEEITGGCSNIKKSKQLIKEGGDREYPSSVYNSEVVMNDRHEAMLFIGLMNCETRRKFSETIYFSLHNNFITISSN